ncbi:NAD(P)/FAD-dependent oxidoreductase [Pedococcus sp. 2YAF34]|uniref:NAD(P)/FAD-dependent oxidoreductase n=1 Tax=Pedococcus sp. 2YAF34 TaxID=3233032 RepID=UPI003F97CF3E
MTAEPLWDLVVVGAGPAGATAALGALHERPGARVLLLDRADFPRDKSCGDGVAPHVLDVLEHVGAGAVADRLRHDHSPVSTLQLALGGLEVERAMRRPALVVPRADLDARLVDAAVAAGAVLRRHRVRHVATAAGEVVLDGSVRGRVVVAADGARSEVRRALGAPLPGRVALGLRGYAPTPRHRAGRQVIRFGEERQPSYAWSFDRGDGWSNVGYGEVLGGRHHPPTHALMVDRLEALLPGSTAGAASWRGHHLPLSTAGTGREQPDGRVLFAGDAAGLVNPLTGEGIYYAVATGAMAGRLAVQAPGEDRHPLFPVVAGRGAVDEGPGSGYRRALRRLLRGNLASTAAAGRLTASPRVLAAGLSAAARDQEVFDDLVELGLGRGVLTPRLLRGLWGGLAGGSPHWASRDTRVPDLG